MGRWGGTGSLNVFGMAAATVAIAQDASFTTNERNRNKAVRDMATKWFADRGMKPTDCQANFMFVNIGTPARAFRDACRAKGVMVARDFPPFEKTHARITLGTMEEMQKAVRYSAKCSARSRPPPRRREHSQVRPNAEHAETAEPIRLSELCGLCVRCFSSTL